MITRETVTRFTAGDGSKHDTLEAAQVQDLVVLMADELATNKGFPSEAMAQMPLLIAKALLARSKHIIDILTTTASSLPKARAVNGGKKPRKAKIVAEQFKLPGTGDEPAKGSAA